MSWLGYFTSRWGHSSSRSRSSWRGCGGNCPERPEVSIGGETKELCHYREGCLQYITCLYMPVWQHSIIHSSRKLRNAISGNGNPLRMSWIFFSLLWHVSRTTSRTQMNYCEKFQSIPSNSLWGVSWQTHRQTYTDCLNVVLQYTATCLKWYHPTSLDGWWWWWWWW